MRQGLLAEFGDADALCAAAREVGELGYVEVDAFTPRPVEELEEILGLPRPRINWASFAVGIGMAAIGFGFQWFCNAWSYPLNVGGRPAFAIPAFIPITFESGVLFASFTSFFGAFVMCGLPRLHHPLFNVFGFERATHDRYFLAIGSDDARFDAALTRGELERLGCLRVSGFGGVA